MNELIRLREAALGLVNVGRGRDVLNEGGFDPGTIPIHAIPGAMVQALLMLKTAAISEDGAKVAYETLRASEAYRELRRLTPQLRRLTPEDLPSQTERLAFWINLYNTLVLDAVISYDIERSVNERLGGLGFFRRAAYNVGGLRFSADDIEHGILRSNASHPFLPGQQFAQGDPRLAWIMERRDPRIHFALNCASRSCPPIAAYRADQIDAQLELAVRNFVDAETSVDPAEETLQLSSIFNWFRDDFGGLDGVVAFVRRYLPNDERRAWLETRQEIDLVFTPYNWELNR
ncbi:DUF547 domain-containing protein [Candidatus Chloroploca asiatica]|uniref:DUF547 domain-containing protein n=1 Tax=Candidatus Chloroploca asiatica TaxID=1506545 RepID=A0A2H3KL22_9CHLR|nr:DUF547 domain-containing protein [Candidatus Chloroploca asiatica]PDV98741.1 hypothetical protein A9Q02_02055 [Candidatus Chloroploca asiatica]